MVPNNSTISSYPLLYSILALQLPTLIPLLSLGFTNACFCSKMICYCFWSLGTFLYNSFYLDYFDEIRTIVAKLTLCKRMLPKLDLNTQNRSFPWSSFYISPSLVYQWYTDVYQYKACCSFNNCGEKSCQNSLMILNLRLLILAPQNKLKISQSIILITWHLTS